MVTRFWSKVDKSGPIPAHRPELGPCWVWTAGLYKDGYGLFKHNGRLWRAPRYSYTEAYGPLSANVFVLHHCDNRTCVRPDHLFLGSQRDNMADRQRKRRQCYGSRNGRAKLVESDVVVIRNLSAGGQCNAAIARQFGVSSVMVGLIVSGRSWRHVPW